MNLRQFLILMSVPAFVISGMIALNWLIIYFGQEILLKAEPVDPRDIFRGDFVSLRYEISRIDLDKIPHDADYSYGDKIFATLSKKEKFWTIDSVSHNKPIILNEGQVCMKGKVTRSKANTVFVDWGIESYFVPERKGRLIERQINTGNTSVIVSVGFTGSSVLKELLINDEPVKFESY